MTNSDSICGLRWRRLVYKREKMPRVPEVYPVSDEARTRRRLETLPGRQPAIAAQEGIDFRAANANSSDVHSPSGESDQQAAEQRRPIRYVGNARDRVRSICV
jgi:hypothetical protein